MKSLLLSAILLSTASIASAAERIMTCGNWTYKLKTSIFSNSIHYRSFGTWEEYCTAEWELLTINDDSVRCDIRGGQIFPLFTTIDQTYLLDFITLEHTYRIKNDFTKTKCTIE